MTTQFAALIRELESEQAHARARAADKLGQMADAEEAAGAALSEALKDEGVPALIEALKDDDFVVRRSAARALGHIGDERAVPTLVEVLNDSTPFVRTVVIDALGQIGSEQVVASLAKALKDESTRVRESAVDALERVKSKSAVTVLIEALQDNASLIRKKAVAVLGNIGGEEVVGALAEALHDPDPTIRRSASKALGRLGRAGTIAPLAEALKDSDRIVRENAANMLMRIDRQSAIAALVEALKDKNPSVRAGAVDVLSSVGDDQVLTVLVDALRDEDSSVREHAADALKRIGGEQAIGALVDALRGIGREKALEETRAFIVHEVRSALGPLRAVAKVLNEALIDLDINNPKLTEYVQRILKQTETAYDVMNHYMSYTKVLMPTQKPADINQLIGESLDEFRQQFESNGIEIVQRMGAVNEVSVDSTLVSQALRNLFLNAIEAMRHDGKLTVSTQQESGQVIINIADTGAGIKPEHAGRIFELGVTTKMGQQGAGLGLALVRRIIEEGHNGRIAIANNPDGIGATVTIKLPTAKEAVMQ